MSEHVSRRTRRNSLPAASPSLPALLLLFLLGLILPGTASSQTPDAEGLWWSLGLGVGWNRLGCDICDGNLEQGPIGSLNVGATLRPGLLLAAEGEFWTHPEGDGRENAASVAAVGYLFPRTDRRLFLKGGIGYVRYWVDDFRYGSVGLKVGIGYSQPVRDWVVINPSLEILGSSFGSLTNEGTPVTDDVTLSQVRFTVTVQGR